MQMRTELSDYFYPNYFVLSENLFADKRRERENSFWTGQDTSPSLFLSPLFSSFFVLRNAGQSYFYFSHF